ncbi:MAG: hypothetical protein U5L05_16170 [Rubrivivax sp.]|nr:hypothetical protein [Rubrivivax sp.]
MGFGSNSVLQGEQQRPPFTASSITSYMGRIIGRSPATTLLELSSEGTRVPRCSMAPPTGRMSNPMRPKWLASRGSVSTKTCSMPKRRAMAAAPRYRLTGMKGKRVRGPLPPKSSSLIDTAVPDSPLRWRNGVSTASRAEPRPGVRGPFVAGRPALRSSTFAATVLEGQGVGGVFGPGQDQPRAAHGLACAAPAQQAVERVAIEFVGLPAVFPHGLPAQVAAVDVVPDAVDLVTAGFVQGRRQLEQLPESFAQVARGSIADP